MRSTKIFFIIIICSLYVLPNRALSSGTTPNDDELTRYLKQLPARTRENLRQIARQQAMEEEARRQARIAEATGTTPAATPSGSSASRPREVKTH